MGIVTSGSIVSRQVSVGESAELGEPRRRNQTAADHCSLAAPAPLMHEVRLAWRWAWVEWKVPRPLLSAAPPASERRRSHCTSTWTATFAFAPVYISTFSAADDYDLHSPPFLPTTPSHSAPDHVAALRTGLD